MDVLKIVIITMLIYSAITCLIFIVSKEDEDVAAYLAIGVIGIVLIPGIALIRKLIWLKNYGSKRSIILDNIENKYYWCKLSDTNDLSDWFDRYKLENRYAIKDEWSKYDQISQEKIKQSRINCSYCKDYILDDCDKCKSDTYELFEPKKKD